MENSKTERTKVAYQLDTPFSSAEWPSISQEDQDSILDLLCNLLAPIGQHRKAYIKASKGKRAKRAAKRKRGQGEKPQNNAPMPPPPEVASLVDVGLSNITRNLQLNVSASSPAVEAAKTDAAPVSELQENETSQKPHVPYSVVFVSRSEPASTFFSHLPQMVAVASQCQRLAEPIRLVGLSRAAQEKLSACMGIPRVTSVALRVGDLTQLKVVVDFVRERVAAVDVRWLEEPANGVYHETRINTIQAPIGAKRQKKG